MTRGPAPTLAALLRRRRGDGPTIVPRRRSRFEDEEGSDLAVLDVDVDVESDPAAVRAVPALPPAAGPDGGDPVPGSPTTPMGGPPPPAAPVRRAGPTAPSPGAAPPEPPTVEPAATGPVAGPVAGDVPMAVDPERQTGAPRAPVPPATPTASSRVDAQPVQPPGHERDAPRDDVPGPPAPTVVRSSAAAEPPGRRTSREAARRVRREPATREPATARLDVRIDRIVVDARPVAPPTATSSGAQAADRRRPAPGPDLEAYLAERGGRA